MTEDRPLYSLEELIVKLEKIRNDEDEPFNYARAFLTLAREIEKIHTSMQLIK